MQCNPRCDVTLPGSIRKPRVRTDFSSCHAYDDGRHAVPEIHLYLTHNGVTSTFMFHADQEPQVKDVSHNHEPPLKLSLRYATYDKDHYVVKACLKSLEQNETCFIDSIIPKDYHDCSNVKGASSSTSLLLLSALLALFFVLVASGILFAVYRVFHRFDGGKTCETEVTTSAVLSMDRSFMRRRDDRLAVIEEDEDEDTPTTPIDGTPIEEYAKGWRDIENPYHVPTHVCIIGYEKNPGKPTEV